MTSVHEAAFKLVAALIDRRKAGLPYRIDQLDLVECEDGRTAMGYCYLIGSDDALIVSFDLTAPFHEDSLRAAFLTPPSTVH